MLALVILGTRLTFFNDDWAFLLQRPGLEGDSVLSPHNGQLAVGVDLGFKALVALFGFDQLPFRLVLSLAVAAVGVTVFLLVAERAGRLLGLIAAALVVFLGPASEALLFFASVGPVTALAAGLCALLAMETDTSRRNLVACMLLLLAVACSGVGLAFVVGAFIAVLLRRRSEQLWIPGIPLALYAVWWLTAGGDATSDLSGSNLERLPGYIVDSAAIGLASVAGLKHGAHQQNFGYVLLGLAILGVGVWVLRGGRPGPWLPIFVGAALTFWAMTGLSFVPGREPEASRFQIVNAALLLVIFAEIFRPVRLRGWPLAAVLIAAFFALASNLDALRDGYRYLQDQSSWAKLTTGALEIARGQATADVRLTEPVARADFLGGITSDRYFEETESHGSPAHYSQEQITAASPEMRQAADSVLAAAYSMQPTPARGDDTERSCRRIPATAGAEFEARLPPGAAIIENPGTEPLVLAARRFAPAGGALPLGFLGPDSRSRIVVPADSAGAWWLSKQGNSLLKVCRTGR